MSSSGRICVDRFCVLEGSPSFHPSFLQPGAELAFIIACLKEMAFASRTLVCFARASEKMKRSSAVTPALQ